jgi:hypothetical protein
MFAFILEVLNEDNPMVNFYSPKPSVKAPRKRTHKPKGKTGLQQLQAEAAGEALALAAPTPPTTTLPVASSSLPPSIPPPPASPSPSDFCPPVEEAEIELILHSPTELAASHVSTPDWLKGPHKPFSFADKHSPPPGGGFFFKSLMDHPPQPPTLEDNPESSPDKPSRKSSRKPKPTHPSAA